MDAMLFIGKVIASPVSLIAVRSRLASLIVSILPSEKEEKAEAKIILDNNGYFVEYQNTGMSFRSRRKGKIR